VSAFGVERQPLGWWMYIESLTGSKGGIDRRDSREHSAYRVTNGNMISLKLNNGYQIPAIGMG
jgi:hypothetical protein